MLSGAATADYEAGVQAPPASPMVCAPACVEVVCDTPPSACEGEPIVISWVVTNCSEGVEDIDVTVQGPGGTVDMQTLPGVGPGESLAFSSEVVHECVGGLAVYQVLATATNECGETTTAVAECPVECAPGPCVDVACDAPPSACEGEEIFINAIVVNCSDRPEDIQVQIVGPGGPVFDILHPDVAPGESRSVTAPVIHQCEGPVTVYQVLAVATNECGSATAVSECPVECGPGPCVEVACDAPPSACEGEEIFINAIVVNCSDRPEDIQVQIVGPGGPVFDILHPDVAPGESRVVTAPVIHQCEGPVTVYQVLAVATNECGSATAVSECPVECGPSPCVEVQCEAPPMGQSGEPIPIIATAVNCSEGPEDITLTVHGPGGDILCQETFPGVPPGTAVELDCEDILECQDEGGPVVYFVEAIAVNDCGETVEALCEVTVNCEPPVQTILKLFEADVDESGIRLSLELYDALTSGSAIIHRGDSEDLKYAYAITPQPLQLGRTSLEYVDETVKPGTRYWYWVELREAGRTVALVGPVSAVAAEPGVTLTFISPARPNPTSGAAVFRYTVGSDVAGGGDVPVSLAIYDSRGRLVKTLVGGSQPVGAYTVRWDGKAETGGKVAPGVYYYSFCAGSYSHRSSVIMLK